MRSFWRPSRDPRRLSAPSVAEWPARRIAGRPAARTAVGRSTRTSPTWSAVSGEEEKARVDGGQRLPGLSLPSTALRQNNHSQRGRKAFAAVEPRAKYAKSLHAEPEFRNFIEVQEYQGNVSPGPSRMQWAVGMEGDRQCNAAVLMRMGMEDDPQPFHGHKAPRLLRGKKREEGGGARQGNLCARLMRRRVRRRRQFPVRLHFDRDGDEGDDADIGRRPGLT